MIDLKRYIAYPELTQKDFANKIGVTEAICHDYPLANLKFLMSL